MLWNFLLTIVSLIAWGMWWFIKNMCFVMVYLFLPLIPAALIAMSFNRLKLRLIVFLLGVAGLVFIPNLGAKNTQIALGVLSLAAISLPVLWFVVFSKKALRHSKVYREDVDLPFTAFLAGVLAYCYLNNTAYFDDMFGGYLNFSDWRIHFYIAFGLLVLLAGIGMWLPFEKYKKVKKHLEDDGCISDAILYGWAEEEYKDQKEKPEDRQKKIQAFVVEIKDLLDNIVLYECGFYKFEGRIDYYMTLERYKLIVDAMETHLRRADVVFLEALAEDEAMPFDIVDLRIFSQDEMGSVAVTHRGDKLGITLEKNTGHVCECCNVYVEEPIVMEWGTYCSWECAEAEKIFFDFRTETLDTDDQNTEDRARTAAAGTFALSEIAGSFNADYEGFLKFNPNTRHGHAAEVFSHRADLAAGKNAIHKGPDNAKWGADRISDGLNIQSKYCKTARETVDSFFGEDGNFKYLNNDGSAQSPEVPREQGGDVIQMFKRKSAEGKIPGIKEEDVEEWVKKGELTYKQSKNICKAFTVESMTYDLKNGAIIGLKVGSVSAAITFFVCVSNGMSINEAFKRSGKVLLRQFLVGGALHFFIGQVGKCLTSYGKMRSIIPNIKGVDKKLSSYGLNSSSVATVLFILAKDVSKWTRGRISGKQAVKNIAISGTVAGVTGKVGSVIGGPLGWGLGTVAGLFAGIMTSKFLDCFIKDDKELLQEIFMVQFEIHARDYLLTSKEVDHINKIFEKINLEQFFEDMYKSNNRYRFVSLFLKPHILACYRLRQKTYNQAMLVAAD